MTDVKKLREKIDQSGYKISFLASKLGITPQGLHLKLNNTNQFKAAEIKTLCELLNIVDADEMKAIFFASTVEDKSTSEVE